MDLINELRNDVAMAYIGDGGYRERMERETLIDLISRIQIALEAVSHSHSREFRGAEPKPDKPQTH